MVFVPVHARRLASLCFVFLHATETVCSLDTSQGCSFSDGLKGEKRERGKSRKEKRERSENEHKTSILLFLSLPLASTHHTDFVSSVFSNTLSFSPFPFFPLPHTYFCSSCCSVFSDTIVWCAILYNKGNHFNLHNTTQHHTTQHTATCAKPKENTMSEEW